MRTVTKDGGLVHLVWGFNGDHNMTISDHDTRQHAIGYAVRMGRNVVVTVGELYASSVDIHTALEYALSDSLITRSEYCYAVEYLLGDF